MRKYKNMEAGMAFVLVSLLASYLWDSPKWREYSLLMGIALLVLNMTAPQVYQIPGKGWMWLGERLGQASSTILLSLVFLAVITPLGLLRRWIGKDSLRKKKWKVDGTSALVSRERLYVAEDLKHPF